MADNNENKGDNNPQQQQQNGQAAISYPRVEVTFRNGRTIIAPAELAEWAMQMNDSPILSIRPI